MAQYDEEGVIVYQAYNTTIAKYAVENKKFLGCPAFSPTRMTWIKTNFLWMMYRADWAEKDKNQSRILAIWLKRDRFEEMLKHAVHSGYKTHIYGTQEQYNKAVSNSKRDPYGFVRLQWDPDHSPSGSPHPRRRAIQLGLKGVQSFVNGDDIIHIQDISDFVGEQRVKKLTQDLETPKEIIYIPQNPEVSKHIDLHGYNVRPPQEEETTQEEETQQNPKND
uniref:DUF4291 domain-containing protein n=1 Tax=Arcella intermedia TaxID=1963864 RepID=A0A6B2LFL7_9EUKA